MCVESKEEYCELTQNNDNKHIVFTDWTTVPDMKTISGTQSLFQVQGHKSKQDDGDYDFDTFKLQCSCTICLDNPQNVRSCHYLQDQSWKRIAVHELGPQKENN